MKEFNKESLGGLSPEELDNFIIAMRKANFTDELFRKVIVCSNNDYAHAMYLSLKESPLRFVKESEFELTVPNNYKHDTFLEEFMEKHKNELGLIGGGSWHVSNGDFYGFILKELSYSDCNKDVSIKLLPGQKFNVKVFRIKNTELQDCVSTKECLDFLQLQGAIMVGAHGLSLVYDYLEEKEKCLCHDGLLSFENWVSAPSHVPFLKKDGGRIYLKYYNTSTHWVSNIWSTCNSFCNFYHWLLCFSKIDC